MAAKKNGVGRPKVKDKRVAYTFMALKSMNDRAIKKYGKAILNVHFETLMFQLAGANEEEILTLKAK